MDEPAPGHQPSDQPRAPLGEPGGLTPTPANHTGAGGAAPGEQPGDPLPPYPIPLDRIPEPPPPPVRGLLRLLLARFPVTAGIAAVTMAMFLVEYLAAGTLPGLFEQPPTLLRLGAVRGDLVYQEGEWFRLLCAVLLHGNGIHLGLNGLAFLQLGIIVESRWGGWRLLAAYGVTGLASSLLSATFLRATALGGSVGASGALMGLAGLLLGMQGIGKGVVRYELNRMIGRRLLYGVLLTFALGIGASFIWPVIDNWGHLGGFLAGLALSGAWRQPLAPVSWATRVVAGGVVVAFVGSVGWMAAAGGGAADRLPFDLARTALARSDLPATEALDRLSLSLAWLVEDGRRDEARALSREVVARDALAGRLSECDDVGAVVRVAMALLEVEHPDADLAAERWVALTPGESHALNSLAWALVTGPPERRDPARALELSRRSLANLPNAPIGALQEARAAFLDTQAEALLQLGQLAEALRIQQEAVTLGREVGLRGLPELEARLARIEAAVASSPPGPPDR